MDDMGYKCEGNDGERSSKVNTNKQYSTYIVYTHKHSKY